jgi:hypothetical protein
LKDVGLEQAAKKARLVGVVTQRELPEKLLTAFARSVTTMDLQLLGSRALEFLPISIDLTVEELTGDQQASDVP